MNQEHIGTLIVELRKRDGLSQKELAEMLNISPPTLCKWERGQIHPGVDFLYDLSEIFNVTCNELLYPTEILHRMRSKHLTDKIALAVTRPRKPKPDKRIMYAVLSILLVIIAFSFYMVFRPPYKIVDTKYIPDSTHGTHYAFSIVCKETEISTLQDYSEVIYKKWSEKSFEEDFEAFEFDYYPTKKDAENWNDNPTKFIFLK